MTMIDQRYLTVVPASLHRIAKSVEDIQGKCCLPHTLVLEYLDESGVVRIEPFESLSCLGEDNCRINDRSVAKTIYDKAYEALKKHYGIEVCQ